jgi:L-ribulose-5-phosphate 3-epimerase
MTGDLDRRRFLKSTAALAALTAVRPSFSWAAGSPKIAIPFSRLPRERTILERFRVALDAGFSGIEISTAEDAAQAGEVRLAAERSGLRVHSVVDLASRHYPLSSADPAVVRQGVAGVTTSLRHARIWGADIVLIAPAAAAPGYKDAWDRSQSVIRERVLPVARDLGVVIAIEEVRGGFVPCPSEVARYVDAFDSPSVKACFDVSRIAFYTHPHDWIRALGPRLVQVRTPDVHLDPAGVDWVEVRRALSEIAYDGWMIAETASDDAASLRSAAAALRRAL